VYETKALRLDAYIKILPLPEPPSYVYTVFSKRSPRGGQLLEHYNTIFKATDLQYEDYVELELSTVK